MALLAGHSGSWPCLRARKVSYTSHGQGKVPRLVVIPGVHNAAVTAGEVAIVGDFAAVNQHISLTSPSSESEQPFACEQVKHQDEQHPARQLNWSTHATHVRQAQAANGRPCRKPPRKSHSHLWHSNDDVCLEQGSSSEQQRQQSQLIHHAAAVEQPPLSWLPALDDQQQQHMEQLLSNAQASTSVVSTPYDVNSKGRCGSRDSTHHAASCTHVQLQQQLQVQPARLSQQAVWNVNSSNRSDSSSNSSSSRLSGRSLVRPNSSHMQARTASPQQIAAVADILHMQQPAAQVLLDRVPQLLQLTPSVMHEAVQQLSQVLGTTYKQAAFMAARQPEHLLYHPADEVLQAARELAASLELPSASGSSRGTRSVIGAATDAPALLVRPRKGVTKRICSICSWFGVNSEAALSMIAAAPELLTDSGSGIRRRLQAIRDILLLWPVAAQRLAVKFPSLLFLSSRIVNNKVKVLMAIMHKDRKAIGLLVYKTPQLLRCNLERVRICYQLLPVVLQRSEGFVYAMAAHSAELLLLPPPKLLVRGARLQAALQMVPEWQQQWQRLRPPQVEEAFAAKCQRFERLEYLVCTQQSSRVSLLDALISKPERYSQQFGSWDTWLQERQQQQQQQRRPSTYQQQSTDRRNSQQQQQHQQLDLHQGQQQLQRQYQQLVHAHLRDLQQRHRQRQMQLQQYRAQLLQRRALQWQQHKQYQQKQRAQQQEQQQEQQQLAADGSGQSLPDMQDVQQQRQQQVGMLLELSIDSPLQQQLPSVGDCSTSSSSRHSAAGHEGQCPSLLHALAPSKQHADPSSCCGHVDAVEPESTLLSAHAVVTAASAADSVEAVIPCTVDSSVSWDDGSLSMSTSVQAPAAAAVEWLIDGDEDDQLVQPQQRQQWQWQQRPQQQGLLQGRRRQQQQQRQQRLWQPAAVARSS